MRTVAQALVEWLETLGVRDIFGIPGVHTIELYRALAGSRLRHITVRSEAGAGFAADGYARVSGRFGVALVITGPGVTNILTPMAQSRADSVPVLVISGVNRTGTLGKGLGFLHELPDQRALTAPLGPAFTLMDPADLPAILTACGKALTQGRGGPVHLEIPLDLMDAPAPPPQTARVNPMPAPDLAGARARLAAARAPVILAGGGCRAAGAALAALAEALDAPVVLTTNARGLLHGHPLVVPASPSLEPVRALLAGADVVLAAGTELGPTDCDMYADGRFPALKGLIRLDIDAAQLDRHPAEVTILGDCAALLPGLMSGPHRRGGAARAEATRMAALAALPPGYDAEVGLLARIRDALPGAVLVGDSTRTVYAGNLWYDHDRPGGWFNSATGFGALGYGPAAAVGAALADPDARVVCLVGDGGLMFGPGEVLTAADLALDVAFVVFNNQGFGEIAEAMIAAGMAPLGCAPTPPDMEAFAKACRVAFMRSDDAELPALLARTTGPRLIEVPRPPIR